MCWKFVPTTPANTRGLGGIQFLLEEHDRQLFYKGVMLADQTLDAFEITGYQQVVQRPGQVVTSHSYHCGMGTTKVAEAHSWFSDPWWTLQVKHAPELPTADDGDASTDWSPTTIYAPTATELATDARVLASAMRPTRQLQGGDQEPQAKRHKQQHE